MRMDVGTRGQYDEPQRVLDPFCGTATTALSAAYHGHESVTMDREEAVMTITKQQIQDDQFGVLLSKEAIEYLGKALQPYIQTGSIGKYINCKRASLEQGYWVLTLTPEQTGDRIKEDMTIWIPAHFVAFLAHVKGAGRNELGFVPNKPSGR